jgi:hypothetical protein
VPDFAVVVPGRREASNLRCAIAHRGKSSCETPVQNKLELPDRRASRAVRNDGSD